MPERYAEFVDVGHHKFYRIQWEDTNNTWFTHWGRIGTKGNFQMHEAPNPFRAQQAAYKQFDKKLDKGYIEKKRDIQGEIKTPVLQKAEVQAKPQEQQVIRNKGRVII